MTAESDVRSASVRRDFWVRAAWWLLGAELGVLQFAMVCLIALLAANINDRNNNFIGVVVAAVFCFSVSIGRLMLGLPLAGIPSGTPGQRVLLGTQAAALAGMVWVASGPTDSRFGWSLLVVGAVAHPVIRYRAWTLYSLRHQDRRVIRRRLLFNLTRGLRMQRSQSSVPRRAASLMSLFVGALGVVCSGCPVGVSQGGKSDAGNGGAAGSGAAATGRVDTRSCRSWDLASPVVEQGTLASGSIKCFGFDASEVGNLKLSFADPKKTTHLMLSRDQNGDRFLDPMEATATNEGSVVATTVYSDSIALPLEKGKYFVILSDIPVTYTLLASYEQHPVPSPDMDPGQNPDGSAYGLGDVTSSPLLGGYVGALDKEDYYRYEVQLAGTLSLLISDTDKLPLVQILQDTNGDRRTADSEFIATNESTAVAETVHSASLDKKLESGTYFVRVSGGPTTYTLSVSFKSP